MPGAILPSCSFAGTGQQSLISYCRRVRPANLGTFINQPINKIEDLTMRNLELTDKELPLLRFLLSVAVNELGSRRDRALDTGAVREYADKIQACEVLQAKLNTLESAASAAY